MDDYLTVARKVYSDAAVSPRPGLCCTTTPIWQLPELIHSLRPDYRLYLRQHDGGVIETVLYALV